MTPLDDIPRRGFLAGSARAAAALSGAGLVAASLWPRTPRSRRSIPQGRTVITYWEKWTGVEGLAVQAVVDRFNAEQDRIFVERLAVSDENSKAMIAVAGGDPPDVMGLFSYSVPQYAQAGAAIPFDELDLDPGPNHYLPAVRRTLEFQTAGRTRLYAGANTCYTLALYCNTEHLKEAGLSPPTTLEELLSHSVALTRRDASGRITRAGFLPTLPWWWYYLWPAGFGSRDADPLYDAAANRCAIADPHAVAAYEWLAEFPKRLGLGDVQAFASEFGRSFHGTEDPFLTGRVSMAVQGPWLANFARTFAPNLPYTVVPLPASSARGGAVRLVECDVLMIPRGCKHPEHAAEFVRFTQRPDVQEMLCAAHAKPSPLASPSAAFLASHPNPGIRVFADVASDEHAVILPRTRVWKQYALLLYPAFQRIWEGAPVAAELRAVAERTQTLLDKDAGMRRKRNEAGSLSRL
ncbi:MAG: extracellular solute-binding protein [Tepidisphaera sp.]